MRAHEQGLRARVTETVDISRHQAALLVLLVCVPVPLLTVGGLLVPFPELAQRALAPLLPFVEPPGTAEASRTPASVRAVAIFETPSEVAPPAPTTSGEVAEAPVSSSTSSSPVLEGAGSGTGDAGAAPTEPASPPDPSEPTLGGSASEPASDASDDSIPEQVPAQPPSPPAPSPAPAPSLPSPAPPPPPAPPAPPPPPPPAPPPPPPPPPAPPPPPPPAPPPPQPPAPPPPPPPPPVYGALPDPEDVLEDPVGTVIETILGLPSG